MKYKSHNIYNGYFESYSIVEVDERLKAFPYGYCGIRNKMIDNKPVKTLVSFESEIFDYCPSTGKFYFTNSEASPNYSRTTIKHVRAFLRQYAPDTSYTELLALYREVAEC